jgi:hypothetical protein
LTPVDAAQPAQRQPLGGDQAQSADAEQVRQATTFTGCIVVSGHDLE